MHLSGIIILSARGRLKGAVPPSVNLGPLISRFLFVDYFASNYFYVFHSCIPLLRLLLKSCDRLCEGQPLCHSALLALFYLSGLILLDLCYVSGWQVNGSQAVTHDPTTRVLHLSAVDLVSTNTTSTAAQRSICVSNSSSCCEPSICSCAVYMHVV